MATLADLKSNIFTKIAILGDGGSGKTGGLASLVLDGYNLKIADFDGGVNILASILRVKDPTKLKNVEVETFKNKYKPNGVGKLIVDGSASAFSNGMKKLTEWTKAPGEKDIIVVDSLTFMGKAAMDFILQLVSREEKPEQQDWGAAMGLCEKAVALLMSDSAKCNVIMNTHVNWVENEGGSISKGYPMILGSKLPTTIGTYFNTILVLKTTGVGENRKREYSTKGLGLIEGKSEVFNAPTLLHHETGLADFFRLARGLPTLGNYTPPKPPTK
jgi:hypothetical protein